MAFTTPPPTIECVFCGTRTPKSASSGACPTCGAPLDTPETNLPVAVGYALNEKIITLNETLLDAGAKNAEEVMSLGCGMGLLVVAASGLLTFWLSAQSWILTIIVAIAATIVISGGMMLFADRARKGAQHQTYYREIEPEMGTLARQNNLTLAHLKNTIEQILPDTAPLRIFSTRSSLHWQETPPGEQHVERATSADRRSQ